MFQPEWQNIVPKFTFGFLRERYSHPRGIFILGFTHQRCSQTNGQDDAAEFRATAGAALAQLQLTDRGDAEIVASR